jgi:hypothetical protein
VTVVCCGFLPSAPQDCKITNYKVFLPFCSIKYSVGVPQKLFGGIKFAAKKIGS